MNDSQSREQQLQSILSNVSVGGNLNTGDITQIFKIFVNLDQISKPQGIPQNIISSSTDKFVGRERDLENLNQQLQRNNQVVIAAVEGMGGVGKTELAIQYSLLNLQLDTYPGGICWIRAREQDIGLQIVNFARTDLDLKPPDDLELQDRVRWCWKRWREGNTLIVFDDVKDFSDIKPYLPPQPSQFKVLITTRLKLDLPSSLYLAVLSESDALELLRQLVGSEKVEQELETAKELCQRLGYLPLALQLVGRYVKKRRISLAEELRRLEEKGLGHPSMEIPENDPSWTLDIKRGVEAAFELSWDELKKSEFAQELGCLLSLFALAPIPWELVESAAMEKDSEKLETARINLESLHLLQGSRTFLLHQLIREFLRQKLEQFDKKNEFKKLFASATSTISHKINYEDTLEDSKNFQFTIPHIAEVASHLFNYINEMDLFFHFRGLGYYYESQSLFTQAVFWQEKCLSATKSRLGSEHDSVAASLINLSRVYYLIGLYKDAELNASKGLELYKVLYGENNNDVARSLDQLAGVYREQGEYKKALPLATQALEMRKRLNSSDLSYSFNNVAYLNWALGNYDEAEKLYTKALELHRSNLGNENRLVAATLCNLAALYRVRQLYSKAECCYNQALEMRKNLLGDEHFEVAVTRYGLAMLYDAQKRNKEAQQLYIQSLIVFSKTVGQNSRWTVECQECFENFLKRAISEERHTFNLKSLSNNSLIQAIVSKVQESFEKSN